MLLCILIFTSALARCYGWLCTPKCPRTRIVRRLYLVRHKAVIYRALVIATITMTGLLGCAEESRSTIAHVYIPPRTHLSPFDRDAIIRMIGKRDSRPVIGILAHSAYKD